MNLFSDRGTRTLDRLLHVQHPGRRDHEPRAHEGALQQRALDRKARQVAEPFVTTLGLLSCKAKDACFTAKLNTSGTPLAWTC